MCRDNAERTMAVMTRRAEAHLAIERDGERVIGELRDERGAVSAFSGWLEFISAVESLAIAETRASRQCNEMTDQHRREP